MQPRPAPGIRDTPDVTHNAVRIMPSVTRLSSEQCSRRLSSCPSNPHRNELKSKRTLMVGMQDNLWIRDECDDERFV